MAFDFFKKNTAVSEKSTSYQPTEEPGLSEEDLDKVTAGYTKTQDEINEMLEDAYKENEAMFATSENEVTESRSR